MQAAVKQLEVPGSREQNSTFVRRFAEGEAPGGLVGIDAPGRCPEAGIERRQVENARLVQPVLQQQIEFGQRVVRVRLRHPEVRPGKMSSAHSLPPFSVHYLFSIWVLQRIFNCNCNAFGEWEIFPHSQNPLQGSRRQTGNGRQKQKARSFGNDRACAYCAERDAVTSDNPA